MSDWRDKHRKAIDDFLEYINESSSDFVLKGGTALLTCYKLDRFSEDVDLDGLIDIKDIIENFCDRNGFSFRIAKDTDTVKRHMINYGNTSKPLKVEVSYRRKEIRPDEVHKINGILVYNIDTLCVMKSAAYSGRDKIRDLYDLAFICNNYFDTLQPQTQNILRNAIEYKGIEQFDYIAREQNDELIDTEKLVDDFLKMHDKLGLLYGADEKKTIAALRTDTRGASLQEHNTDFKERLEDARKDAQAQNAHTTKDSNIQQNQSPDIS